MRKKCILKAYEDLYEILKQCEQSIFQLVHVLHWNGFCVNDHSANT
jgi:hypothetical protein